MNNNSTQKTIRWFVTILLTMITTWLINTIAFVQTVVADDFMWSEIGVFTIIQGSAILLWPLALVTGPLSLIL